MGLVPPYRPLALSVPHTRAYWLPDRNIAASSFNCKSLLVMYILPNTPSPPLQLITTISRFVPVTSDFLQLQYSRCDGGRRFSPCFNPLRLASLRKPNSLQYQPFNNRSRQYLLSIFNQFFPMSFYPNYYFHPRIYSNPTSQQFPPHLPPI